MRSTRVWVLVFTLAILAATTFPTTTQALTKKLLHNFNGKNGAYPYSGGLTIDAAGNLYGATTYGGGQGCYDGFLRGCGVVFELTPQPGGGWSEKVLHYFGLHDPGGYHPNGGLVFDASGNLYGTTSNGGRQSCGVGGSWCGAVFELMPSPNGAWAEVVLHSFYYNNNTDGVNPRAGLVFDASGNLYGTTRSGGQGVCSDGNLHGCGTVFEITPTESGWTEQVLYSFQGTNDGIWPEASLILDGLGNLYGTTNEGGAGGLYGAGIVFELTPDPGGGWTEKILHTFDGSYGGKDGNYPSAGVTFDVLGNLYGATKYGPSQSYGPPCENGTDLGCGTVFALMPNPDGSWTEEILHYFSTVKVDDGNNPSAGVILDSSANLYGTTGSGGAYGSGTVFELTDQPDGTWTKKQLSFNFTDGATPSGVIFDAAGNMYGMTVYGGAHEVGTVFEIIP